MSKKPLSKKVSALPLISQETYADLEIKPLQFYTRQKIQRIVEYGSGEWSQPRLTGQIDSEGETISRHKGCSKRMDIKLR